MIEREIDATNSERIASLGQRVITGDAITHQEAEWLISMDGAADIYDVLAWANRIREHFKGNKVHLCSIVNVKAGGCSENCKFCAQSSAYQTESPRYGLVEDEAVMTAADEAQTHGVTALGLVAAWRGL